MKNWIPPILFSSTSNKELGLEYGIKKNPQSGERFTYCIDRAQFQPLNWVTGNLELKKYLETQGFKNVVIEELNGWIGLEKIALADFG
ncbi:hypothetical protein [Nostoc sp. PA-18-2419]|uniref:hypothetical protein n=1 Tax=Nostoc sp. PA-18-2419 TaxID=2575443 RepID=UPI00167C2971|nr:hypothetical protein [Nostoc sp. PA-18-2419]